MNSDKEKNLDNDILREIEKIRERTFDDEFKELVDRVTSHDEKVRDFQRETENALLGRFQKLFYKSSNLFWRTNAYVAFNPLELPSENMDGQLAIDILTEMDALGFPHFALLTYDFQKKSFACKINHITQLNRENIVLDVDEQLFRKTIRSNTGIIVRKDEIVGDIFLKKRFSSDRDNFIPNALYFLSLECFQEMVTEECGGHSVVTVPTIPMILLVLLDQYEMYETELIFEQIRKKMALHFMLYKNIIYPQAKSYSTGHFEGAISVLEYYYTLYCRVRDGSCMLLYYSPCAEAESDYLFAFLMNKLLSSFSPKIAAVTLVKHATILFIEHDVFPNVMQFIEQYNDEMGNFLEISIHHKEQISAFHDLMNEYFKKI
ncbi:MAG: hypothetical protein N2316_09655 [Spirochaetes bacterium]|nr:hypothetical protein [Spirochaetota bacterium]